MANGDFSLQDINQNDILRAVVDRIRLQAQRPAARLAQNIRTTGGGLRTSGVSLQPQIELARGRTAGEAQAVVGLGQQELGQRFGAEQASLQRQFQLQLFREGLTEEREASARARRGRLQQALGAGGVGLITSIISRKIGTGAAVAGAG